MKNGNHVAGSCAFKILIALHRRVIEKAVRGVRENRGRFYFRVHRLGEDVIKGQAKYIRAEVIDVGDSAEVVAKLAFAIQAGFLTALIYRRISHTAVEHA